MDDSHHHARPPAVHNRSRRRPHGLAGRRTNFLCGHNKTNAGRIGKVLPRNEPIEKSEGRRTEAERIRITIFTANYAKYTKRFRFLFFAYLVWGNARLLQYARVLTPSPPLEERVKGRRPFVSICLFSSRVYFAVACSFGLQRGAIEVNVPRFKPILEHPLSRRNLSVLVDHFDRIRFGLIAESELGGSRLTPHRNGKDPGCAIISPDSDRDGDIWVCAL